MNSITLPPANLFADAAEARRVGDLALALNLVRRVDAIGCTLTSDQLWFVELIEFEQALAAGDPDRWADHFRRLADTARATGEPEIIETALIAEIMMHVHAHRPMRALAAISTLCGGNDCLDSQSRHELNIHYGFAVLELGYLDSARSHFEYLTEQFSPVGDLYLWGRAIEGLGRCMHRGGGPIEPVATRLDHAAVQTGAKVLAALAGSLRILAPGDATELTELARSTGELWRGLGHEHRAASCEQALSPTVPTATTTTNSIWASGSEAVAPIRLNPPDNGLLATARSLRMEDHPSLGGRGIESQFVGSAMARTLPMPTTPPDDHPVSANRLTDRIQDRSRPRPLTDVVATITQVRNDRNTGSSDTAIEFEHDSIAVSPLIPVGTRMFRSIVEWVIDAVQINSGEAPVSVTVGAGAGVDHTDVDLADGSDQAVVILIEQRGDEPTTPTEIRFFDRLRTAARAAELVGGTIDLSDAWAVRVAFPSAAPQASAEPGPAADAATCHEGSRP